MPLPLILGAAAAVAGAAGVGSAIHGGVKMKKANDTMKQTQEAHTANVRRFEIRNERCTAAMDRLGKLELEILQSFQKFSDIFERIQNKPEFRAFKHGDVTIPTYSPEDLKKVSVGAGVLLGGLSGAALGTAGGFAAAGATTAAVMALGTASTGTAIASLSGAAATNATLAALGGGALAAGGGGIALGTTILGATTLGMGLLVGGIIFNFTGNKLSAKADEAMEQMKKAKTEIDRICAYLESLHMTEERFEKALSAYDILKFYTFLPPLWAPFGLHSIHFRRMVFSAWAPQTGHHGHHFGFCRNRNLISSKEKTLGNSAFPRVFGGGGGIRTHGRD